MILISYTILIAAMEHFNKLPKEAQEILFPNGFQSKDYCHSRDQLSENGTVYDCVIGAGRVLLIKDGKIWINFDDEPEGCKDLYTWGLKHPSITVEYLHQYGRKLKNMDAPKPPFSAYLFYAAERRGELKKLQPDLPFGDLTHQIAAEWKQMKKDGKTKEYDDLAELDKDRFRRENIALYGEME